ncbi:MAG: LuxR C-terminal-related transcriptional regulator [Balneolaceae bacterium]
MKRLSPRECEVLDLIEKGKSSDEIAAILFLSKKTVDFHRAGIRRKAGIDKNESIKNWLEGKKYKK